MACRFVDTTKTTVHDFLQSEENKNTKYKTRQDVGLLYQYLNSIDEQRQIEQIPPNQLNEVLSISILSVRKKNGE